MFSHTDSTQSTASSTQMPTPSAATPSFFPFGSLTMVQQEYWQQQLLMQQQMRQNSQQLAVTPLTSQQFVMQQLMQQNSQQPSLTPLAQQQILLRQLMLPNSQQPSATGSTLQLPVSLPLAVSTSTPGEKPKTVKPKTKRTRADAPKKSGQNKKARLAKKEDTESKEETTTESVSVSTSSPVSTPTALSSPVSLPTFFPTPTPTQALPLNPPGMPNYGVRTHSSNPKATTAQLREEIDTLCKQITIIRENYSGFQTNYHATILQNQQLSMAQGMWLAKLTLRENQLLKLQGFLTDEPADALKPATEGQLSEKDELIKLRQDNYQLREKLNLHNSLEREKNYPSSVPSLEDVITPLTMYSSAGQLPPFMHHPFQEHPPALSQSPYGLFTGRTLDPQSPATAITSGLIASNISGSQILSPNFSALMRRGSTDSFLFGSPAWGNRQLPPVPAKTEDNASSASTGMSFQNS